MGKRKKAVLLFARVTLFIFLAGIPLAVFYTSPWGVVGNMFGAFYTLHFIREFKNHG